jgi:hypothetical protein
MNIRPIFAEILSPDYAHIVGNAGYILVHNPLSSRLLARNLEIMADLNMLCYTTPAWNMVNHHKRRVRIQYV